MRTPTRPSPHPREQQERRKTPDRLLADRGYDFTKHRRLLWARGIKPVIAKRGVAHGSGPYERHPELHTALLVLACAILCWRRLKSL